jgi:flagellar export protein FliJ
MKKFSFPLDRVLVWRRLELEREQAALQRLLADRNALAAKETAMRAQRSDAERLISANRYVDAETVATLPDWQSYMKKAIAAAASAVVVAEQKAAAQQARFFEAKRRVGLLERLREKRLDGWEAELGREEEAFAAEAFLARSVGLRRRVNGVGDLDSRVGDVVRREAGL